MVYLSGLLSQGGSDEAAYKHNNAIQHSMQSAIHLIIITLLLNLNFRLFLPPLNNALVAELVDAHDSKSCAFGRGGSIPSWGTMKQLVKAAFFVSGKNAKAYLCREAACFPNEETCNHIFPNT